MSRSRDESQTTNEESVDFVTVVIAGQLFGIPVSRVQDVFSSESITSVPLARQEVAGVLNLRGRIVTAVDVRERLGLKKREVTGQAMAIGIEKGGESYGLIIDEVGEVLSLDSSGFETNPSNLNPRWQEVSKGIYRLEECLLVILDVDRVLSFDKVQDAA